MILWGIIISTQLCFNQIIEEIRRLNQDKMQIVCSVHYDVDTDEFKLRLNIQKLKNILCMKATQSSYSNYSILKIDVLLEHNILLTLN